MGSDWRDEGSKKAVGIVRVSSARQQGNSSHELQVSKLREYAIENGLQLVRIEPIVESAKQSDERRKYSAEIQFALTHRIKHILFYMSDREARNLTDNEANELLVLQGKVAIHYVNDRKVLHQGSPSSDFFTRDMNALMNKNFSRVLAEKMKDVMLKKAENGWYPGNHPPLGYVHEKHKSENGRLAKRGTSIVPNPNPRIVKLVQREFELRAEGLSFGEIRKAILEEGLVEPSKIASYSKHGIEARLKNKFYSGVFDWPQGVEHIGKHVLIIDQRILARVKASFGKRGIRRMTPGEMGIFSGGWLRCADPACGLQVIYDPKVKKIKATGETKSFPYYHCSNSRNIHPTLVGRYVTEEQLWADFAPAVEQITITENFAQEIADALNEIHEKAKQAVRRDIQNYRDGLVNLEVREDKLYDDLHAGVIDKSGYKRQLDRIRDDRRRFTNLLEQSQLAISDACMVTARKILGLATQAKSLWNLGTQEERMEYLKNVCSDPVLDGVTVRYEMKKPFQTIARMKGFSNWRPHGDSNPGYRRERAMS